MRCQGLEGICGASFAGWHLWICCCHISWGCSGHDCPERHGFKSSHCRCLALHIRILQGMGALLASTMLYSPALGLPKELVQASLDSAACLLILGLQKKQTMHLPWLEASGDLGKVMCRQLLNKSPNVALHTLFCCMGFLWCNIGQTSKMQIMHEKCCLELSEPNAGCVNNGCKGRISSRV